MRKFMDYQVLVEMSIALLNRLHYCQLKQVTSQSIVILLQVLKTIALKYDAFRKLWHQLTPYIQIMSPRTDLCDTCQHFRNGLQYNARKEEAKDLLRKCKEHLVKAKLERNYYNKSTKLAEQQRKLVDEHFITRGKADYCSIDATAHYSYDWAQNVHVPHSDQQVSKIYNLSPRKVVYKMKQYANK